MSSDQPDQEDFTVDPRTMRFQGVPAPGAEHAETHDIRGLSAEDQATIEALRPGTALLIVLRGPNTGARFLLDDLEVSTGRHPDSDIFLDDVTVSRKHALFVSTDDGYLVRDVGLAQRHLRQPRAHRRGRPAHRRRGADRQVPARLLRGLSTAPRRPRVTPDGPATRARA